MSTFEGIHAALRGMRDPDAAHGVQRDVLAPRQNLIADPRPDLQGQP